MRKCPRCGRILPETDFAPRTRHCKLCRRDYDWQKKKFILVLFLHPINIRIPLIFLYEHLCFAVVLTHHQTLQDYRVLENNVCRCFHLKRNLIVPSLLLLFVSYNYIILYEYVRNGHTFNNLIIKIYMSISDTPLFYNKFVDVNRMEVQNAILARMPNFIFRIL